MSSPSLIKLPKLVGSNAAPQNFRNSQGSSVIPSEKATRASLDTLSGLSIYSANDDVDTNVRYSAEVQVPIDSPLVASTVWKGKYQHFWHRNKGVILVIVSQFFFALMITTTRILETDDIYGAGMAPFQVSLDGKYGDWQLITSTT